MGETVGAVELRRNLGAYIRRAKDGEQLLIAHHGRPVAELRPLPLAEAGLRSTHVRRRQIEKVLLLHAYPTGASDKAPSLIRDSPRLGRGC